MRAVVYDGPFQVSIQHVKKPTILHPDDIIVKGLLHYLLRPLYDAKIMHINHATGFPPSSDLHMYEGRTAAEPGIIFGHEKPVVHMVTSQWGPTPADKPYVPISFPHAPSTKSPSHLLIRNTARRGLCPVGGYLPYRNLSLSHVLSFSPAHHFLLFQGWHGVQLSGFQPGESIAVFGAGPVGLMAAYSAILRGASEVYVVDRIPERLAKAREIGCIAIDFTKGDPAEQIIKLRGREVDRGVDAVGYQATASDGKTEQPNVVLEALIAVVRPTGGLGIPGLYVPTDPGAPDSAAAKGYISFPFGKLFEKGLTLGTGQCNVKSYNRYLRDLIIAGRAKPSFVVSHNLPLDSAPNAYVKFDQRVDGYTKVLLHP
ncbi:hypothetical protein H0H87_002562 [Tephrocybe sp. NHM501043]|nr:hypothetical protein H0H87_002562 [Tephrocybe sp. NHM501043]